MIKAKFNCQAVDFNNAIEAIFLSAVTNDSVENKTWSKYTPAGQLNLSISNPDAQHKFVEGQEYYLEVTKCS